MKLILFIAENLENAEKYFHTQSNPGVTLGNIWHLSSLASCCTCLSTVWFDYWWWVLPSLSTASADQGSGSLGTSESPTCWVGICFTLVDCILVLLGMNIGIGWPVVVELPIHFTGPETTTTLVCLPSSAFQYPAGTSTFGRDPKILYE